MKATNRAPIKIVTVDDSIVIAERIQFLFRDLPYVKFAGNARNISSALELIMLEKPDVAILDIHLDENSPKQNGIYLLKMLRKQYFKMNIIVLTNFSESLYRKKCLALGADHFFDKSNDIDRLVETLATIQPLHTS